VPVTDSFSVATSGYRDRLHGIGRHVVERTIDGNEISEVSLRKRRRKNAARQVLRPHARDARRIADGKRREEQRFVEAEGRRVEADAQRENQGRADSEPPIPGQRPTRVASILRQGIAGITPFRDAHRTFLSSHALRAHTGDVAKPLRGLSARRFL